MADLSALSSAELVDAAGGWARAENAACARKLAVMAEIFVRRTGLSAQERELWWLDPQAAVAAEMAAAVHISHGLALHQTHRGVALRDRLPQVAALFEAGLINEMLVRAIVWRTYLIEDPDAMAAVDAALAQRARRWGAWSVKKTEAAIDALIDQHDPGALRRTRETAGTETVEFGAPTDVAGITSMWARLHTAKAALIETRLAQMANSVCAEDPRTMDQRRVDAMAALAERTELACACGQPDCPAPTTQPPTKNTVVYVIADKNSLDAADCGDKPTAASGPADGPAAACGEESHEAPAESGAARESSAENPPPRSAHCAAPPAYVLGGGVVPTALLGGILQQARIREVRHPGDTAPEPRYTPSRQTCEFVRCRDLTCRFPGCDKPAPLCDIDHTVPHPVGPTHPSNLKCLCRFHHLLKTFWAGVRGWRDRQLPDGTVIWTAPTGHTYTTYPASAHLFPQLCEPTATIWDGDPPVVEPTADRGVMMPKRRHTRAHTTAKAIKAERRLNDPYLVERNKPPPF